MENRYCVIMGGGVGSRFWPFSRNNRPKQFLDFFGIGRSLLQMSFDRFAKIIPKDHIFIVTNEIYVDLIKEQLPTCRPRIFFWSRLAATRLLVLPGPRIISGQSTPRPTSWWLPPITSFSRRMSLPAA